MPSLFDKRGHSLDDVIGWEFLDVGDLKLGRQGRPWFITRNERKSEKVGVCGPSVRQRSESFAPPVPSNFFYGKMYPM